MILKLVYTCSLETYFSTSEMLPHTLFPHQRPSCSLFESFINMFFHAVLSITSQNINHIPDAHSCQDVQDIVDKLTVKAVSKIREYLLQKVYQFRKPLSNYQIPQNAMIKHKYDPVWNIKCSE